MNEELMALQQTIQVVHRLMQVMSDPQAVAVVGQCLQRLTALQQQVMQGAQQGGAQQGQGASDQGAPDQSAMVQALAQRLQGGGGGAPQPAGY